MAGEKAGAKLGISICPCFPTSVIVSHLFVTYENPNNPKQLCLRNVYIEVIFRQGSLLIIIFMYF